MSQPSKNLVSKITFKSVCGAAQTEPVQIVDDTGTKKTVLRGVEKMYMRVIGVIYGTKLVTSNYGDSIEFAGQFQGINLDTGEVYEGGKLFLPNVAEMYTAGAFNTASQGEGFKSLDVAFDIGVKPSNNAVGYEYTVKPLIQAEPTESPLTRLSAILPPLPVVKKLTNDVKPEHGEETEEKPKRGKHVPAGE